MTAVPTEKAWPGLICEECGAEPEGIARGWRAPLTVDDERGIYCPDCADEELNDV